MENKNYSTVFEADLAYLRSLGDTSECKTEFEVRLKTLRKLGGDIQTTTPLLYEIEKKILDFLGGDSSLYDNIYFIRKAIAEKQGVNTEGLHTIYAIAVASLNSEPVDVKYTITFKNYDGTILETQSLSLNEMPVYKGETPVKPSDEEYNYTFNGWLPEISPVSGNAEYVAQYTAVKQVYTIKFVNYDGTVLGSYNLEYGETPTYTGETPVKPSDEEYNYTFNGWLPEISPVSGNAEYVAQFEATAIPTATNYVTFTAEEAGSTLGLSKLSTNQTLEYSTDTTNWTTMDTTTSITLSNVDDEVYVRGILSADNTISNYTQFKMTGKIASSGNCNAIWNYEDLEAPLKSYCGYSMFSGCTSLTTAPELPATTLETHCYFNMFSGCTSLTAAPELPAITLASNCYQYMFNSCSRLTTAPELPATTLAGRCYYSMFSGCTSLTAAPELPATELAEYCYSSMFNNCTALTTAPELPATTLVDSCYSSMFNNCTALTTAPELPATTLVDSCYYSMFSNCSSLTTAPELPATTLETKCYYNMFSGCTSLKTAPELPATTLVDYCYQNMFYKCSSLTTAPELPATTLASYCYQNMFYKCSSLKTAPELPATTLASYCYQNMFNGCSKLNSITCLATNISVSNYTYNWLSGVSSTGTFIKHPDMTSWTTGTSGIPDGWTVEDYTG